ncbi:T/G mismatch-specific endonuclease [Micromonospora sediminicola]|uniref:T/G mismatch-specific endonuclease n=2 Tax=Micromonospora sediminicola TaxID=946078 RepID=A0A1A9BHU9_9ACTN|nr:T/G mismatch-specific endonuclease [Micromonospora sediminicola]
MTGGDGRVDRAWADTLPPERAWKGRKGRSRQAVTAEQDRAAGGPDRRWVDLDGGRQARASVELKLLPKTRRLRAYLRWSDRGRSPSRYLGEVGKAARALNLAEGWRLARERGLLAPPAPVPGSWAKSRAVRLSMQGNKGRDTEPERQVRSILFQNGLRYRVNTRPLEALRRTADVVFPGAKIAVFVDGCYWHGCPEHYRPARENVQFWHAKIEGNKARDAETDQLLAEGEWQSIRIWEHEEPQTAALRVIAAVQATRVHTAGPELAAGRDARS